MRVSVLFIWYAVLWLEATSWRVVTATVQTGSLHLFLDMLSPFPPMRSFSQSRSPFIFHFSLFFNCLRRHLIADVLAVNIWIQKLTFHFNYHFIYSWYPQWLWLLFILTSLGVCFQWNQIRASLASDSPVFYLSQTAVCVALAKGLLWNTVFHIFLQ